MLKVFFFFTHKLWGRILSISAQYANSWILCDLKTVEEENCPNPEYYAVSSQPNFSERRHSLHS